MIGSNTEEHPPAESAVLKENAKSSESMFMKKTLLKTMLCWLSLSSLIATEVCGGEEPAKAAGRMTIAIFDFEDKKPRRPAGGPLGDDHSRSLRDQLREIRSIRVLPAAHLSSLSAPEAEKMGRASAWSKEQAAGWAS